MAQRVGGIIQVAANGQLYDAYGEWTWNLGRPKAEAVLGTSAVVGYKEMPQVAFIEGEIIDRRTLSVEALLGLRDASVTLYLANGKLITLRDAWYAAEGTGSTENGNIECRFEGMSAEEVTQ